MIEGPLVSFSRQVPVVPHLGKINGFILFGCLFPNKFRPESAPFLFAVGIVGQPGCYAGEV